MLNLQERSPETIQNPGADTKILFNDSTDGLLKTKDSSGVVETLATTEGIAATEPKVYVALLTQTGTDAPVATVLKNTLGGTVVWSYLGVGSYEATSIGGFTENKTALYVNPNINVSDWDSTNAFSNVSLTLLDTNTIRLSSIILDNDIPAAAANDIIILSLIKIEVYP